ncbi:hypothetical protein Enr13x_51120 [Stieleria neptunia]|uniref:Uncharacterized protein n=1 Tax=Stieleria neptunia TaxID=2527979 RepID=A0A518HWW2_9BACT|nr:hypothetical protein Enr13x_51120 [Stieleria neptunia]
MATAQAVGVKALALHLPALSFSRFLGTRETPRAPREEVGKLRAGKIPAAIAAPPVTVLNSIQFSYPESSYLLKSPRLLHSASVNPTGPHRTAPCTTHRERKVGKLRVGRFPAAIAAPQVTALCSIQFSYPKSSYLQNSPRLLHSASVNPTGPHRTAPCTAPREKR